MRFLVVSFKGARATQELLEFTKEVKPLGFIIYRDNVESPQVLKELIATIRSKSNMKILFFVDEEGGEVSRVIKDISPFPSPGELGEKFEKGEITDEYVRELGRKVGEELQKLGIDVNLAPVLDLRNEFLGNRAYSNDFHTVAKLGLSFALGIIDGGVQPCIKHFPGHGVTNVDSHKKLPVYNGDYLHHISAFLEPMKFVKLVMTAHIVFKRIDPEEPVTTSKKAIDFLKSIFQGVVVSDDICMEALSGSLSERANKAFNAGCDIIISSSKDYNENAKVKIEASRSRLLDATERLARVFKLR